jgi:cyclomaltodextrinase
MRVKNSFCITIFLLALILQSCLDKERHTGFPLHPVIYGLLSPTQMNPDSTKIYLSDFFPDVSKIDSVKTPECFPFKQDKKKMTLTIYKGKKNFPFLSELKIYSKGTAYSILLKKSGKVLKSLVFDPHKKHYSNIRVAGEFNNWNPTSSDFNLWDGKWSKDIYLNPGSYQYQLVADGKWMLDPANPDSADNHIGGDNSVLKVAAPSSIVLPRLFSKYYRTKNITIGCENADSLFVLWQNFRMPSKLMRSTDSGYVITIPEEADKLERSFIRVFACNKSGVSNDLLIPLKFGRVISDAADLNSKDLEAQVMYFLLVDRFYDKDTTNDKPINDPEVSPKANYMGGDFKGIISKIEDGYFNDLGINSLWISPVNLNPDKAFKEYPEPHRKFSGYHGYWPISSTKVDYRFGTALDFRTLVRYAHRFDINVILDYVANHVHKDHPLYKQHPDWATSLTLPDGRKNIRLWDEQRLTTWFDTFLPTLDFSKQEVVECMTDSALYWIKTFDIDGFRHDATKHIPENYWRRLTQKIKNEITIPYNKPFYQIGETYGSRELIGSYINSGELDAQFDFNLFFDMRSSLLDQNESFSKLRESVLSSLQYYGYHNLMGNITGNHDMARFISFASGALSLKEDEKEAGWKRDIEVKDTSGYQKLSVLTALVMTLPGIPVMYYGDEIGMAGAGDPDNRRMMKFDKLNKFEKRTKEIAKQLIHLRRTNMPLIYGDLCFLNAECNNSGTSNLFIFARCYFNKIAIVLVNKGNKAETVSFAMSKRFKDVKLISNFKSVVEQKKENIRVSLPANSFEILTN